MLHPPGFFMSKTSELLSEDKITNLRTVPGNQEFIILSKSRLARIFNRGEDVLSSNGKYVHVETPSDGSTATGPAVRHRHFLVSLSSDLVASQVSLEDGTAFGGF